VCRRPDQSCGGRAPLPAIEKIWNVAGIIRGGFCGNRFLKVDLHGLDRRRRHARRLGALGRLAQLVETREPLFRQARRLVSGHEATLAQIGEVVVVDPREITLGKGLKRDAIELVDRALDLAGDRIGDRRRRFCLGDQLASASRAIAGANLPTWSP
jgi:hypothetical protein